MTQTPNPTRTFYLAAIDATGMSKSSTVFTTLEDAERILGEWVTRGQVPGQRWDRPLMFATIADADGIIKTYDYRTSTVQTYVIARDGYMGIGPSMSQFEGTFHDLLVELLGGEETIREFASLDSPVTTDAGLAHIFEDNNGDGQQFIQVWSVQERRVVLGGGGGEELMIQLPERPRTYTDRQGNTRTCRLDPAKLDAFYSDPMTTGMGVDTGEFTNDWRKQDLRDGCPFCRAEVTENASEPDVMKGWEL